MSTPPPPFPPNQPGNQPPFGTPPNFGQPGSPPPPVSGGGIAPPSWQSGGPGSPIGLTASPVPPTKSKAPLVIGAIVAVAILIVVGVVVLGGDDDSGGGGFASAAAGRGLDAVLRDGSYDSDGYQEVRSCPLGDVDDLTAAVGEVLELDDALADGTTINSQTEEGDFPGYVACQIYADDDVRDGPNGLYFQAVLDPPRSYETYIEDFSGDSTSLQFEDSVQYRGGEVFLFCGEANDDDGYTGCDADWVNRDDNIALNVFLGGEDQTTEDAFTALKAVIATMADNLAEFDVEES